MISLIHFTLYSKFLLNIISALDSKMFSKSVWILLLTVCLLVLPALSIKLPIKQEEIMVSHPDIEPGYERWGDYLQSTRIGKLYHAYNDLEDVGINFAEFDYNQKDYVGEGTHLMPGSR